MKIFTPNTLIKSSEINANFDELENYSHNLPVLNDRQDNAVDNSLTDQLIQYGWGFQAGNGTANMQENVTFPQAFDNSPVVLANSVGGATSADPIDISGFTVAIGSGVQTVDVSSITTTGFRISQIREIGATFSTGTRYGYAWIAIGTKAR